MTNSQNQSEHIVDQLAPTETLLGQIQRGRGAGFLRAVGEDQSIVHPLLLRCITDDPRWDTQVEERADYYARLALLTGLGLSSIEPILRTAHGSGTLRDMSLPIDTLGRMAQMGSASAIRVLRGYVAYGPQWDFALERLAELSDRDAIEGLADIVCSRFSTGKEMAEMSGYGLFLKTALEALWDRWRPLYPCITHLLDGVREAASKQQWEDMPDYQALPTEELLAAADKRNSRQIEKTLLSRLQPADAEAYAAAFSTDNPYAWSVALRCLGTMKQDSPFRELVLDKAVHHLADAVAANKRTREHVAVADILEQLPVEITLPVARRWYEAQEWQLRYVGERILEQHATLEDLPRARAALSTAMESATPYNTDAYRVCAALDILSRIADVGPIPQVEEAFVRTAYSPARRRAARAMQSNAPDWFSQTYAFECMWDCDEETREIGCQSVSLIVPGAPERLRELAQDHFESDLVRNAAATRPVSD